MRLWFPRERYALDVVSRLLLAPTELILDALPPLQPNSMFLEVQAGAGPLARPLADRIAGLGRLVAVDWDEALAANLPRIAGRAARAVAEAERLPFPDATFDGVFVNTALGEADRSAWSELRRVLRPRGWLLASILLRGSFSPLLDALVEACVEAGAHAHGAALLDAQRGLLDETGWRRVFDEVGMTMAHLGVEERALFFASSEACARDALISDVLLPSWLGDLPALPSEVVLRAAASLAGGAGSRVSVRLRTAVITVRASLEERAQVGTNARR